MVTVRATITPTDVLITSLSAADVAVDRLASSADMALNVLAKECECLDLDDPRLVGLTDLERFMNALVTVDTAKATLARVVVELRKLKGARLAAKVDELENESLPLREKAARLFEFMKVAIRAAEEPVVLDLEGIEVGVQWDPDEEAVAVYLVGDSDEKRAIARSFVDLVWWMDLVREGAWSTTLSGFTDLLVEAFADYLTQ